MYLTRHIYVYVVSIGTYSTPISLAFSFLQPRSLLLSDSSSSYLSSKREKLRTKTCILHDRTFLESSNTKISSMNLRKASCLPIYKVCANGKMPLFVSHIT